jgi:hypothetical protein
MHSFQEIHIYNTTRENRNKIVEMFTKERELLVLVIVFTSVTAELDTRPDMHIPYTF